MSDQGLDFTSNLVKKLCKLSGVKKIQTGSYWPQTDGTTERWHRTLNEMYKVIGTDKELDFEDGASWDIFLPLVANAHSNKYSARIGMSPNQLHFGHKVKLPIDRNTEVTFMDDLISG